MKFWACCVVVFLCLSACNSSSSGEESRASSPDLLGEWAALWEMDSLSMFSTDTTETQYVYTMPGRMIFSPTDGERDKTAGKAEIVAYGSPYCVISADTLTHQLNWVWQEDTLRFVNEGDTQGLDYILTKRSQDTLTFTLVEDLTLQLVRVK